MMRLVVGCVGVLLSCLACGTVEQAPGEELPSAGSAAAGSAGSGSAGTNSAGASDTAGASASGGDSAGDDTAGGSSDCPAEYPHCLASCDPGLSDLFGVKCVAGAWQCGPGRVDAVTCAPSSPGSCAGKPLLECRSSCSSRVDVSAACVNGKYECPSGSLALTTCPADSCAQAGNGVCCSSTGAWKPTTCLAGVPTACAAGSSATLQQCFPEDVQAKSCFVLDGQACTSTSEVCNAPGSCGESCSCTAGPSGDLLWFCTVPVC